MGALGTAYLLLPLRGGGIFHWLRFLSRPIDGGRTVRGRPLFGANKTFRGLLTSVTYRLGMRASPR